MPKRSMESFGATKPSVGRERAPNVNELVEMLDWPKKGGSVQVRVIGSVAPRGVHKIKVTKRTGEETEITKACLAYDPAIDDRDSDKHCPYCEMDKSVQRFSKVYFANVIDRRLQEDQPARVKITPAEKKSGFKDMDSSSWTPVRVMRAPSTLALRLKQLGERNVVKSKTGEKKVFPVNHPKFGFDLDVSFDKSLPAASMYSADRNTDDKYTPLTEEESEYLVFDLDLLYPPEEEDAAESEATSLSSRWKKAHSDEDEDEPKAKKKTKKKVDDDDLELDEDEDEEPKKSKKKKVVDDDDELDLDDEDEPTTKSKKPTKKKVVDDDDDLELDEDEDEEPKKSKKPTKKKVVDEDDDEDELDLDDEDEPPKKSSKKKFVPSVGSQVKITDEDDEEFSGEVASIKGDVITIVDDEDERTRFRMADVTIEAVTSKKKSKKIDDEDDEDEPPAKSKKKPTKKKVDEDDDEDEDLDLDEDEDEEDEPPKKSKKPAKKKPVEDFDDDDIPF